MASLFVSHSSQDAGKTAELVRWLRAEGFDALFVDFDPECGIPGGRNWERELYAQLRRADGVVYVASPASAASRWCFAELSLARSIGKPILPVLVAGTERVTLLTDVQWVDVRSDSEAGLHRVLQGLHSAGIDARDAFGWDANRSPFPGLDPFRAEDAAVFFGRTSEIGELLDHLQPTLQRGRGQFLAVVGPSGSGKSSLVGAGLLPRVARRGWIALPRMVPGERPLTQLARSLTNAFAAHGVELGVPDVEHRLEEQGSPGLVALAQQLCDLAKVAPVGVVVFLDQAEELVTRTGTEARARFLRLLRGALHPDSPVWVLATLRSEFLGASIVGAGLAEIVDDTFVVGPLPRERLPEVIEKPAQRAGLDFEAGLVQRMVDDTVGGDTLPLLAYTLRQLYELTEPGRPITRSDYEAVGGVVGALRRQADGALHQLLKRHTRSAILPVLLRLVTIERGAEPLRRRVLRSVFHADQDEIIQAFIDARLLRSYEFNDDVIVEVAHEALLRQWPPLSRMIEDSKSSLRMRSELEALAIDWSQGGRDDSYLLRGTRLAAFDAWADQHRDEQSALPSVAASFLDTSTRRAQVELRSAHRRRIAFTLVNSLLIVLLIIGVVFLAQRNEAVSQRNEALKKRSDALSAVVVLLDRSDLLARSRRVIETYKTMDPDKFRAVEKDIQALTIVSNSFGDGTDYTIGESRIDGWRKMKLKENVLLTLQILHAAKEARDTSISSIRR